MNRLWVAMVFIERSGTLNSTFQCQFAHHVASVFKSNWTVSQIFNAISNPSPGPRALQRYKIELPKFVAEKRMKLLYCSILPCLATSLYISRKWQSRKNLIQFRFSIQLLFNAKRSKDKVSLFYAYFICLI